MNVFIVINVHEKQILMQERICMKCPHTSNVEGDHYFILNMHKLVETWLPEA